MSHFHKFSQYSRLFLECSFSSGIWYHALGWLGVDGAASIDCVQHFLQHGLFRTKKTRKVKYISFGVRSVVWCLWLMHNKIIFQGEVASCTLVLLFCWLLKLFHGVGSYIKRVQCAALKLFVKLFVLFVWRVRVSLVLRFNAVFLFIEKNIDKLRETLHKHFQIQYPHILSYNGVSSIHP